MGRYSVHIEELMRRRVYSLQVMKNNGISQPYDSAYRFTKETNWHIQNIRSGAVHPDMQIGDEVSVQTRYKGDLYHFTFKRTV